MRGNFALALALALIFPEVLYLVTDCLVELSEVKIDRFSGVVICILAENFVRIYFGKPRQPANIIRNASVPKLGNHIQAVVAVYFPDAGGDFGKIQKIQFNIAQNLGNIGVFGFIRASEPLETLALRLILLRLFPVMRHRLFKPLSYGAGIPERTVKSASLIQIRFCLAIDIERTQVKRVEIDVNHPIEINAPFIVLFPSYHIPKIIERIRAAVALTSSYGNFRKGSCVSIGPRMIICDYYDINSKTTFEIDSNGIISDKTSGQKSGSTSGNYEIIKIDGKEFLVK